MKFNLLKYIMDVFNVNKVTRPYVVLISLIYRVSLVT